MPKSTHAPSPDLARLRTAATLIPVIESDVTTGKISTERAALMCEFCSWACESQQESPEESTQLLQAVTAGLARIKSVLTG